MKSEASPYQFLAVPATPTRGNVTVFVTDVLRQAIVTLELKPGGNHLMFMKLSKPIGAGQKVALTLVAADGAVLKTTVIAKNFAGANEEYDGATMGDM